MCSRTRSLRELNSELSYNDDNLGSLQDLNLELLSCKYGLGRQGDHSPLRGNESSAAVE